MKGSRGQPGGLEKASWGMCAIAQCIDMIVGWSLTGVVIAAILGRRRDALSRNVRAARHYPRATDA